MRAPAERSRRVLVTPASDGSAVLSDGRLALGFDIVPTVYSEELWETPVPADLNSVADRAPEVVAFPKPGQVIARMLEFRPAADSDVALEQAAVEKLMADEGATRDDLHRTQSMDFFAVVSGEVTLRADGDEVQLAAGDFAVCLGALHGWSCTAPTSARIFAVLSGARDYGDQWSGATEFASSVPSAALPWVRRVVLGHDQEGRSRILDDSQVRLPARLWCADALQPTNVVAGQYGSLHLGRVESLADFGAFDVVLMDPRQQVRLPGRGHQLLGVVVDGEVTLRVNDECTKTPLVRGDMWVVNGFDVDLESRDDSPALICYASLPGSRS